MRELARYVIHFEEKSNKKFNKILRLYHPLDFAIGSKITFNKKSYKIYDISISVQKDIHSSISKENDLIDITKLEIYCKLLHKKQIKKREDKLWEIYEKSGDLII